MINFYKLRAKKILTSIAYLFEGPLFKQYKKEIEKSGIIKEVKEAERTFYKTVKGVTERQNSYGFGAMSMIEAVKIYSIIRKIKPNIIVETGVCNGVSTAFILLALQKNNHGNLYSIDFPEEEGMKYKNGIFWNKKGGAVIPKNKQPGWFIKEDLRNRWELILGKTQNELSPLLNRLGKIDIFIHDSEHSYECMKFEYNMAYKHLSSKGVLLSHDISWNSAYNEFAKEVNRKFIKIEGMGLLIK